MELEKLVQKFGLTIEYFYPKYVYYLTVDAVIGIVFHAIIILLLLSQRHKINFLWEHSYSVDTYRLWTKIGLYFSCVLASYLMFSNLVTLLAPEGKLISNLLR